LSASWVTFLFEAGNFLLLAAVLVWFFFRPVRDAIERRRSALEGERVAATEARHQAERELEETRARRREFEGSLDALRKRVQSEAQTERERLIEEARALNRRERDMLDEELLARRRAQARSLSRDAAYAAREIVVGLLAEVKGPELEPALCQAACRELEGLRAAGSLAPIVVESVSTLDDEAFASLVAAAGVEPGTATRRVNPDLIAGLRVLTAKGLVDASAAGLAAQAESVLASRLVAEEQGND